MRVRTARLLFLLQFALPLAVSALPTHTKHGNSQQAPQQAQAAQQTQSAAGVASGSETRPTTPPPASARSTTSTVTTERARQYMAGVQNFGTQLPPSPQSQMEAVPQYNPSESSSGGGLVSAIKDCMDCGRNRE